MMAEVKLECALERDMDLLIMRGLAEDAGFGELYFREVGLSGARVLSVEHSLTDARLGESDVTAIVEHEGKRYGILIEDKIDAVAMPEQCARYSKRGDLGVEGGAYEKYFVFITAPSEYLETDDEAAKYPHRLSYEAIRDYLAAKNETFWLAVVERALDKAKAAYVAVPDVLVEAFWRDYHAYCRACGVGMNKDSGHHGSNSGWIYYQSPLRGVSILHKTNSHALALEFTGMADREPEIRELLQGRLAEDMALKRTGKSMTVEIPVPPVDMGKGFEAAKGDMPKIVEAAQRLQRLARSLDGLCPRK